MSDSLPLFESRSEGDDTFSVLELNNAISTALQDRFPGEVWVRGEIQGLSRTRMRRHWYFELVEKEPLGDGVRAKLSVALLQWNRREVDRAIASNPSFGMDDGIEVRIRGRVGYYAPFGKLQLEMTGIDPAYTLGQLAANRERILAALLAEGLLEKNQALEMPAVPLHVGLVTSVGSAAYNDFVQELAKSGFGFEVTVIDARVQGAETEDTVVAALASLARRRPDVIALVRGGGSQSDLAGFDAERIARAIAAMPVPVLTGIGHEIDVSVADHVAHSSYKTPTAVAAALVERTREFAESVEGTWDAIAEVATQHLQAQSVELGHLARAVSRRARSRIELAERDVAEHRRRLSREALGTRLRTQARLQRLGLSVRAAGRLALAGAAGRLARSRQRLSRERLDGLLARPQRALDRVTGAIAGRPLRICERRLERLGDLAARCRALDPARVLARGFSLTYDARGRLLRSAAQVAVGDSLRTDFVDGRADSRVDVVEVSASTAGASPPEVDPSLFDQETP